MEFMIDTGPQISEQAILVMILITDGVGKEYLGMVTIFCHHDCSKMEHVMHSPLYTSMTPLSPV